MADNESLVPPWSRLTPYCLRALEGGTVMRRREARAAASQLAELPDAAYHERLASGGLRIDQRLNWAITHLAKAGLVEQPERAHLRITEKGRDWLAAHPDGMSYSDAHRYFGPYWPAKAESTRLKSSAINAVEPVEDPDEIMDVAQAGNRETIGTELLERLRSSDPTFFEEVVIDLLLKMGYGGAEKRGEAIGRSGDGGLDGVIDEDILGLDRIYVQAKRYSDGNNVPAAPVQAFVGALHGKAATKGVFITTSRFTPAAIQFAEGLSTQVRLIDGKRLVSLMLSHLVGVQVKNTYTTVQIDEDYFD